jgi:hypothetical protein
LAVPVRLIVQNKQERDLGESTSSAFETVSEKKAVYSVKMTSSPRPVAAKLGIQSSNQKQPNILKIIPSSAAVTKMLQKKIMRPLPTAVEDGTRYLIPTLHLAELQQKLQQQFPGFRGTVTITSIKPIDTYTSSILPLLIVPESKQHAPSPISISLAQQKQQPLNSSTTSTALTAQNRSVVKLVHLLQPVQVPVENRICLSNPAKPLSIIIKKDDISQPLARKPAVKKSYAQVNILPAPSNVRPIPSNKKPIASIQEDQALNNVITVSQSNLFTFVQE